MGNKSVIVMRTKIPSEQMKPWKTHHPKENHYDFLVTGDAEVRSPDGQIALMVLRNALSEECVAKAEPVMHWMRRFTSDNRGQYAGARTGTMRLADGRKSKSTRALDADGKRVDVASTIAGYYERQGGRHPFCRQTAFLRNYPDKWQELIPMIREAAQVYKKEAPLRFKRQMDVAKKSHPAWLIADTPFSTVTINNTVPAAYHVDGGDLKDGLGVLLAMEKGKFDGFELVVPEYRVAVRLQARDVLLFDPTIWHGNIPPYNTTGVAGEDWYRISVVLYYRAGIVGCGSPEEELERAKNRGAL